ncbi:unknown [Methanothermobacter thermautotrophicus str. Delta H]|jgi:hypothetical protein|uniref:Uncharacterized protein n=1 Tax=Methanothermobacter thermautotrophicus (strain ATCC 29096 / DSM 1053 / JCM 10044 / NBRC 100330 / Delta H) TaxID=187420 RepID=O26419_METTH|nr:unknown [Methanothermobacter thermautotrophicus str. Delta H]
MYSHPEDMKGLMNNQEDTAPPKKGRYTPHVSARGSFHKEDAPTCKATACNNIK